jgi:hypothetical protein
MAETESVTTSDGRAKEAGYRLLTPASFHHTAELLICWECPHCAAVVSRAGWYRHELDHRRQEERWSRRHEP